VLYYNHKRKTTNKNKKRITYIKGDIIMKKFYICEHCGNIIGMVKDKGVPVMCCGQKMKELVPNTVEASGEKHIPAVSLEGNVLKVNVGSVNHPMAEEHFIEWVYVETENGGMRKNLKPGQEPNVTFALGDDKAIAVYAYCNLHGLWMAEV
jgi:superoxide reductase